MQSKGMKSNKKSQQVINILSLLLAVAEPIIELTNSILSFVLYANYITISNTD